MSEQTVEELARALRQLRAAMSEVAREHDRETYLALANRYARLHARWEQAVADATDNTSA